LLDALNILGGEPFPVPELIVERHAAGIHRIVGEERL
jgi:hypothetical protein